MYNKNKAFSNPVFRKITALLLSAAMPVMLLSACNHNSGGSSSAKISEDEAKKIALEDCGLQESEICSKKSTLDTEDRALVYKIELYSEGHEYEYEIDANSGKIISKSKEGYNCPSQSAANQVTADGQTTANEQMTANEQTASEEQTYVHSSEIITEPPRQYY